jgi:hypothetical protein
MRKTLSFIMFFVLMATIHAHTTSHENLTRLINHQLDESGIPYLRNECMAVNIKVEGKSKVIIAAGGQHLLNIGDTLDDTDRILEMIKYELERKGIDLTVEKKDQLVTVSLFDKIIHWIGIAFLLWLFLVIFLVTLLYKTRIKMGCGCKDTGGTK